MGFVTVFILSAKFTQTSACCNNIVINEINGANCSCQPKLVISKIKSKQNIKTVKHGDEHKLAHSKQPIDCTDFITAQKSTGKKCLHFKTNMLRIKPVSLHSHGPQWDAPLLCSRAVTDSINQLITLCTQQAPGQKECDNALRELEVNKLYHLVIKHSQSAIDKFQYKPWSIRRLSFWYQLMRIKWK